MEGLSNTYVHSLCKKLNLPVVGVFSCDKIKKVPINHFAIINLDKARRPGTHFVVIKNGETCFEYFDPLGFQCYNVDILNYFLKNNKGMVYNETPFQALHSNFCGYFCIAHVINETRNKFAPPLKYSDQLFENDARVVNYIVQYINKTLNK